MRPDKRAIEQDAEAVRVRREETWPAIHARAKAEGGAVLFADQVGIRSDQVTGRTWGQVTHISRAPHGPPLLRQRDVRDQREGTVCFMVFTETFDADVMCRFLDRLAGHFGRKVHLVVDGTASRAHHGPVFVTDRRAPAAAPGS
ncbi:hypothetical protein [Streptomyces umbrinus]|uniref:hypothetical protein n=1 Tax=Streptomyces umbrinus TaxID=67370 RepID=UPI003C2D5C3D